MQLGGCALDVRGTFAGPSTDGRPPLVLVHGIGMSGEYFLPFAEELAAEYDVYSVDLPGYGSSPRPPRALTIPELGEAVVEAIRVLGLDGAVVVGHSMGSQVVAHVVAGNPGLCRGYVLVGPTVDRAARGLGTLARRLLRDSMGEPMTSNIVALRSVLWMGPLRYLQTARHMFEDRIEETIARCEAPGLVVRGALDPIAPIGWAVDLVRRAPDAGLVQIPGARHAVQHNEAGELARACAPFLAGLRR